MNAPQFDCIVIGSGAGGSAAAYRLARAGLSVCIVEKGERLPRDGSTLDFDAVVHSGRFKSKECWHDGGGQAFAPEEYFNVGGKTKWYGAALLRYGQHEFEADAHHDCRPWPLSHAELTPYYDEAEALLGVRTFETEPDLAQIIAALKRTGAPWIGQALPLGLSADILDHRMEAMRFDGFASVENLKSDADTRLLSRVTSLPRFTLLTGDAVDALLPDGNARRVGGVQLASGRILRADHVLLAAGALHSPRLLERYLRGTHLDEQLPIAQSVGRNLKLHLLTAVVAISPSRKADLLRKTTLLLHDTLPHSSIQPLGFDGQLIGTLIPKLVPRVVAREVGERAYGFFLQTEDGSHPDNRVIAGSEGSLPVLDYEPRRTPAALMEHLQLIRRFRWSLARIGMSAFSQRIGVAGTAHACGTLIAGDSPIDSVVDREGRVHGLEGLYVVDGSVLPRSSRVNPSLTIYAWGLRVADRLARRLAARPQVLDSSTAQEVE